MDFNQFVFWRLSPSFILIAPFFFFFFSSSLERSLWLGLLLGEEAHEFGAVNTLLFVVVLATCFLFTYLIKKYRLFYLPESAAVILLGVFVGFIASKLHSSKAELDLMTFQPELFYFGLLPPLIFDAGCVS
jgi:hypothetical protein